MCLGTVYCLLSTLVSTPDRESCWKTRGRGSPSPAGAFVSLMIQSVIDNDSCRMAEACILDLMRSTSSFPLGLG